TPSTQLDQNGNGNRFASLIELLDALEATEQEDDGDTKGLMDGELPIAGQGAPEATGVYHDQAQTPLVQPGSQGQPRRKAPPPPVKLPGAQDASCAVGDARLIYERRQMPAQRLNDHLRNNGMCSASSRDYAVGLGRKQIAQDEARAAAS